MSEDLFLIEPSAPSALHQARARLARAETKYAQAEELLECQGQEAWQVYCKARAEWLSAVEELKALEKLKEL